MQAVEIDRPGCSYNPDAEQHQDAVAEAVAAEMSKIYANEHNPRPPRVFNHMPDLGELHALLVSVSRLHRTVDHCHVQETLLSQGSSS